MTKKKIPEIDQIDIHPKVDPFSIETMPLSNARVLFVSGISDMFRDSGTFNVRETPDGKKYVSWGGDNQLPYSIIDQIESDETMATCQMFNAEVCYGAGLQYNTSLASPEVRKDVEDFILDNPMPEYFLGVCQDMKHFNFAVTVLIQNAEGSRIVEIHRKPACYCRFAPVDPKTGRLTKIIFGQFRSTQPGETFEEIELLDPRSPWRDLRARMGLIPGIPAKKEKCRKFAVLTRVPGVDNPYYPIPHYAAIFKGAWYKIKRLIGEAKRAKLENSAPIKYVIEVSQRYWENIFMREHAVGVEAQQKLMREKKEEMMNFLTNHENTGSVLFTPKSLSVDGSKELADIAIVPVDSKTKEGGDWESDIAEAINVICFTMRVHSNLVGSVPGKAQTNNSGSDKRELYTIAQALQKPYRDLLFLPHQIVIRFNGWDSVFPECPFIQLTTLDEHADAKNVTLDNHSNNDIDNED